MTATTHETRAITVGEVAKILSVSPRHVWSLDSSGRLPMPIRLGKSVRWRRDEIHAWIEAGAPTRDRWERMKGGRKV